MNDHLLNSPDRAHSLVRHSSAKFSRPPPKLREPHPVIGRQPGHQLEAGLIADAGGIDAATGFAGIGAGRRRSFAPLRLQSKPPIWLPDGSQRSRCLPVGPNSRVAGAPLCVVRALAANKPKGPIYSTFWSDMTLYGSLPDEVSSLSILTLSPSFNSDSLAPTVLLGEAV